MGDVLGAPHDARQGRRRESADGASLGSWEPVCPLVPVPVVLKSDELVSLQLRTELTANKH